MKSIKLFLVITTLLLVYKKAYSQSGNLNNKVYSKALQKTDKINNEIKSENASLALSQSQKRQIIELQIKRLNANSAFISNISNSEEVKAKSLELNKAMNRKIRNTIFTEEQAEARKACRKKMKGKSVKGEPKISKASKKSARKKSMNPVATITIAEADAIYATATSKQLARAEKATEKLNAEIIASDASLALSDDQIKKINALNLKPLFESEKLKKEGLSKEEIKLKNKEVVKSKKRLINSLSTKEQKNAQKKKK